ncbi:MAG: hypothetical protein IKT04_05940 [Clostridia bacterium]|nr:hypothetical protein [Clostridia bacterium]
MATMKTYHLRPATGTVKQAFFLDNENGETVYEGKMLKFSLLGASPFEFKNCINGKSEEHKLGKVSTLQQGGDGWISLLSTKSSFKFDDKNIWDYLHDLGVRINSRPSGNKLGMTYTVALEGNEIATIASSSPKGKSLITTDLYYDVTCEEKDLDIVFLVAFSIARTSQVAYN